MALDQTGHRDRDYKLSPNRAADRYALRLPARAAKSSNAFSTGSASQILLRR